MDKYKLQLLFIMLFAIGIAFFCGCLHSRYAKNLYPNSVFYGPSFPGGKVALEKFILSHRDTTILIPDSLNLFNDTFFSVYTNFKIDTDGSIDDVHLIWDNGIYRCVDIESIVKAMPKWMPAYEHNRKTGMKRPYKMITGFGVKYYYKNKKPK